MSWKTKMDLDQKPEKLDFFFPWVDCYHVVGCVERVKYSIVCSEDKTLVLIYTTLPKNIKKYSIDLIIMKALYLIGADLHQHYSSTTSSNYSKCTFLSHLKSLY